MVAGGSSAASALFPKQKRKAPSEAQKAFRLAALCRPSIPTPIRGGTVWKDGVGPLLDEAHRTSRKSSYHDSLSWNEGTQNKAKSKTNRKDKAFRCAGIRNSYHCSRLSLWTPAQWPYCFLRLLRKKSTGLEDKGA